MSKIEVKIPSGQTLVFPEGTSETVIQNTVKKITDEKGKAEWTDAHVKSLVRELTMAQGEVDLKKAEVDHFGPAIEKQTKEFEKVNQGLINSVQNFIAGFLRIEKQRTDGAVKKIEPVMKQLVGQMIILVSKIESSNTRTNKSLIDLTKATEKMSRSFDDLSKEQKQTNKHLAELVKVTGAKKVVKRDNSGNITGIE
jgi:peptidoglycan hydrolase CwlO-like protein